MVVYFYSGDGIDGFAGTGTPMIWGCTYTNSSANPRIVASDAIFSFLTYDRKIRSINPFGIALLHDVVRDYFLMPVIGSKRPVERTITFN